MPNRIDEVKPRPRDRVTIRLSGGRFFTIPEQQAEEFSVGDVLPDETIERLDRMDQYFRGRDKAMTMIARRARTREEIRRMLDAVEGSVRDGIISDLEELGLIDDARYAREYVATKAELRHIGPHRLRYELGKRGIRREYIEAALNGLDAERQREMAWTLVERKLGTDRVDERAVRRIAGLLRRKGFDYEVVNSVSYALLQRAGGEATPEDV